MTVPLWITIPLCIVAACVIAFGVLGVFVLIDIFLINKKGENE